ncbi:hypothetical protein EIP86_001914 [Pleurotus ostreatoroseus]|nr:hypothetical protein EIP86_001914 [Pleurotus ostreatoroseus]
MPSHAATPTARRHAHHARRNRHPWYAGVRLASLSAIHPTSLLPSYVHHSALIHMLGVKLSFPVPYSPAAPLAPSFGTPPPAYSCNLTVYSWSPGGSTTSSASPFESPVLLTLDLQFARPARHRGASAHTDAGSAVPENKKLFDVGDAADLGMDADADVDMYAACDGVRPPNVKLPTLPHLAKVVPPTLLHPNSLFGPPYMLDIGTATTRAAGLGPRTAAEGRRDDIHLFG